MTNLPPHVQRFLANDQKHAKTAHEQAMQEMDDHLASAQRTLDEIEELGRQIEELRQRTQERQAQLPPPVRLGLIDSLIVMASTLFGVAILIILVAAIFL